MKNTVKNLLHTLGIYETTRKVITKIYYPYKNYRIRTKASKILEKMQRVFETRGEEYWLDYGTLLGFVREGRIIKGDLDLDFGVLSQVSFEDELKKEQIYLTQRVTVEGVVAAEQYRYEDIGFDVFYYRKIADDKIATNVWLALDCSIPQKVVYEQGGGELGETVFSSFTTKEIVFYGVPFRVPEDSDRYLQEHFGEDYMIPNPNFTHRDEKNRIAIKKEFEMVFYG